MADYLDLEPEVLQQSSGEEDIGRFRVQRKGFFLTYPQSADLTKDQVLAHLSSLGVIDACSIGQEQHQDGTPHIHAVVLYKSKINSRNQRLFDIGDRHPHISNRPVNNSTFKAFLDYCEKEDQSPLRHGRADTLANGNGRKRKRNEIMADILKESTTRDEFLAKLREAEPWEFVKFNSSFENFADKFFPPPIQQYSIPDTWTFKPTEPLDNWVSKNLIGPHPVISKFFILHSSPELTFS